MLGARISLVLVAAPLAAAADATLHSRADANAGPASAYSETTRYVSNSQFSGDTQGAVTEDDPGSNTAAGALAVTDPDDGDNPSIET